MGSTAEPDRKRRHLSSISPTAAATAAAKKQPLFPSSEDKKLDIVVLQYQNQKLVQQLEAQKVECSALEKKIHQLKEKQKTNNETLIVVKESWEQLVGDLESHPVSSSGLTNNENELKSSHLLEDGASCPAEDEFLSRLLEKGATESCSDYVSLGQIEDAVDTTQSTTKNILQNMSSSINYMWHAYDKLAATLLLTLPEDEPSRNLQKNAHDLQMEVRSIRMEVGELHLRHRTLADKVQNHRDMDAKNKAEYKRLAEELATTIAELDESNFNLANLKAQKDAAQGTPFIFPAMGNKHVGSDKVGDKRKEAQDLESKLKDLTDLVSSRLVEIRNLHEERIEILKRLATLQNALMDFKSISSSKAFLLLSDQLDKSKAEMDQCQMSLEKLQVEKDNFIWHEKVVAVKVDLADVSQRVSAISESRIAEREELLQRLSDENVMLETKLEAASREPGREQIIAEFKELFSSYTRDMQIMQNQLGEYKEAPSELHSLRAEVQSLSGILQRKGNELEVFSGRSSLQLSEIHKLQMMVRDLKETDKELKLFLDMYRLEATDTWDVIESRDMEYEAWAQVQSLKASLDEHSLEVRVKAANEAEAVSQQLLATAEAEIADLRQKLDVSRRDIRKLFETLKSKQEEGESYLTEIESIGQAYDEMKTQNQHLLQQITERDDYNIKLGMEAVKGRQLEGTLLIETQTMDKEIKRANSLMDFYKMRVSWLDDQLKAWSEQVGKLVEDGWQSSVALENVQRRYLDVRRDSQQSRQVLDDMQSKVERSRLDVAELQIELEKERFNKKRVDEKLKVVSRKAACHLEETGKSAVLQELQQEISEYRGILKCSICHDRQKEVVIVKCYHLFCNQCVQRTLESRHRKCPTCATSFGANDVKPIYI